MPTLPLDLAGRWGRCQFQSKIAHILQSKIAHSRGGRATAEPRSSVDVPSALRAGRRERSDRSPARSAEGGRPGHAAPPSSSRRARSRSWCSRMRKLLPRMLTMWQWCRRRSMSAAAITSSPSTPPHSSKPLVRYEPPLWGMALRVRRSEDDHGLARPSHPPLRHHRDR